jgi:hypothetical protein
MIPYHRPRRSYPRWPKLSVRYKNDPFKLSEALSAAGTPPVTMERFFQHRQAVLATGDPDALKALGLPPTEEDGTNRPRRTR